MKGIILLNGNPPKKIEIDKNDLIVCADGAYNWATKLNVRPDIILGDLDSIKNKPEYIDTLKYPTDKNFTDGEICLNYLMEKKIKNIHIWGAFGKRTDHLLGNFSLLKRGFDNKFKVVLRDAKENIFLWSGLLKLHTFKNMILSIVPFSESAHIMYSKGLQYPLDDLVLQNNSTRGISNITTSEFVELNITSGIAMIYVEKWRD